MLTMTISIQWHYKWSWFVFCIFQIFSKKHLLLLYFLNSNTVNRWDRTIRSLIPGTHSAHLVHRCRFVCLQSHFPLSECGCNSKCTIPCGLRRHWPLPALSQKGHCCSPRFWFPHWGSLLQTWGTASSLHSPQSSSEKRMNSAAQPFHFHLEG